MRILVLLQVLAAGIAALSAHYDIQSILGSCPVMAVIGLALAMTCIGRELPVTLVFALSAPIVTTVAAMLIFIWGMGPRDAARPVGVILACYFVGTLLCLRPTLVRLKRQRLIVQQRRTETMQFSLRTALVATTFAAAVFALTRWLSSRNEMKSFGVYAGTVFAASMAIALCYASQARRRRIAPGADASGSLLETASPPAGTGDEA